LECFIGINGYFLVINGAFDVGYWERGGIWLKFIAIDSDMRIVEIHNLVAYWPL